MRDLAYASLGRLWCVERSGLRCLLKQAGTFSYDLGRLIYGLGRVCRILRDGSRRILQAVIPAKAGIQ
ncbi:hypothetical protein [Lysobacter gummosus]|uniref:hypothetical protein n=1 Tax=Lysobacter gummosus TaxID=262324 RepID=UPI003625227C